MPWNAVPAAVRGAVGARLGSAVVSAATASGGYSPAVASRCVLADGSTVFIKAGSAELNEATPVMMRREAAINFALPDGAPAPKLLALYDEHPWVVLVFEAAAGHIPHTNPWDEAELAAVLRTARTIADLPVPPMLRPIGEALDGVFGGWRRLHATGTASDDWWSEQIDELVELESGWAACAAGEAFIHGDLRSDNCLVGGDVVTVVDWTSCAVGAPWFDVISMLPSIESERGGTPEQVLQRAGIAIPSERLLPVVAALAGYFADASRMPAPAGMPTVRAVQADKARITQRWLQRLLG